MAISNGFNLSACLVWGATVAAMVCIAATEWSRVTIDLNFFKVTVSYGLYRFCKEILGSTECENYDDEDVEDYHQVSRILSTTGMCLFIVASLFLAFYMFMLYKDRSKYKAIWSLLLAMICTCVAGVLNIVGVGLYARHNDDQETPDLYWAFYVYIISTIVGVVGGFLAYFGRPSPVHPTNAVNGTIVTTSTVTYHHQRQHQQHPHYSNTVIQPPPPPYGAPTGSYNHSPYAAAANPAYPPTGQGYPPSAYPPPPGQGYPAPAYAPPGQDQAPAYPPPNPVTGDPAYPPGNPPPPQYDYQPPPQP